MTRMVSIEEINTTTPGVTITQNRGDNILDSISSAYSRLSLRPVVLVVFIMCILSVFAENNNATGPFEIVSNALGSYIKNVNHPAFLRTFAALVKGLIDFILKFKEKIFNIIIVCLVPFIYPNSDTFFSVLGMVLLLSVSEASSLQNLLVSQLFFIYYSLQTAFERLTVMFLIFLFSFGWTQLETMLVENSLSNSTLASRQ